MKKILITGANSYIGTSFENYLKQWPDEYQVDTIDMIDGSWREKSFAGYDTVFHVAGIAHQKETRKNKNLYYNVNRDLAVETAKKAKKEGVKQFIFLSSMSVYGMDTGIITEDTIPSPNSNYGKSKLEAEEGISPLEDDTFSVCILRPPMVYGANCKGNFRTVVKFVNRTPIFPKIINQRSLIYIDNLCNFIKKCIEEELSGVFFPQNKEYMNTSQMAKWIAESLNKKIHLSSVLKYAVNCFFPFSKTIRKAFGTLIYKDMEVFHYDYCIVNVEESVKRSV